MATQTINADDSEEWEEEETTVVVELSGILESDFISKCDGDCKVLGIDTDKPLLQLDRYTFSGEYSDTMGTNLLFTQQETQDDPRPFHEAEPGTKKLEYLCKVDKKLSMSRVFVSKIHQEDSQDDTQQHDTQQHDTQQHDTQQKVPQQGINRDEDMNTSNGNDTKSETTKPDKETGVETESEAGGELMDTSCVGMDSETTDKNLHHTSGATMELEITQDTTEPNTPDMESETTNERTGVVLDPETETKELESTHVTSSSTLEPETAEQSNQSTNNLDSTLDNSSDMPSTVEPPSTHQTKPD